MEGPGLLEARDSRQLYEAGPVGKCTRPTGTRHTVLLVDEVQDLTPCQPAWLTVQSARMPVFFVADVFQLVADIYGFILTFLFFCLHSCPPRLEDPVHPPPQRVQDGATYDAETTAECFMRMVNRIQENLAQTSSSLPLSRATTLESSPSTLNDTQGCSCRLATVGRSPMLV